ncbi:hypothetical protein ANCCAN_07532 [Ancylostoma caninum]|uniref:Uncharacterized protein n=1 Tax=Ancylostoma caninum TaxID=29170 RepID=A0A368GQ47_ANCCA|nr:hypothetical protein ANCCAN_07532 [Ancylostoma caninum]
MHRTLAEEITEIVKQNGSPAPDYSCTLERIAHKLLSKNGGLVGESYEGYKFTSTNGLGNINFWIVLNSWKENLSKVGAQFYLK